MMDVDGVFSHFQATPLKLKLAASERAPAPPERKSSSPPRPAAARRPRVHSKMVARQPSRTKLTVGLAVAPAAIVPRATKRALPVHPSSVKKRRREEAPAPDDDDVPVRQTLVFDSPRRSPPPPAPSAIDLTHDTSLDIDFIPDTPPEHDTGGDSVERSTLASAAFETPKKSLPPPRMEILSPPRMEILSPLSYLRLTAPPAPEDDPPGSPNVFDPPPVACPPSFLPETPPLPAADAVESPVEAAPAKPSAAKRELLPSLQTRRSARLQAVVPLSPTSPHLRRTPGIKVLARPRPKAHVAVVQGYVDSCVAAPASTSTAVCAACWASLLETHSHKVLPQTTLTRFHGLFKLWIDCEAAVATEPPPAARVSFANFDQSAVDLSYCADPDAVARVTSLLRLYEALLQQLGALTASQRGLLVTTLERVATLSTPPIPPPRALAPAVAYFASVAATPVVVLAKLSALSASLVRHLLRLLFLSFDASLDDGPSSGPSIAVPRALYQHHDLGAAVHRALADRAVATATDYAAAVRADFLAACFGAVQQSRADSFVQTQLALLEETAGRLARLAVDDDAHLFPLRDVDALQRELASEQRALAPMLGRQPPPQPWTPALRMALFVSGGSHADVAEKESTPLKERRQACDGCFECKRPLVPPTIECRTCHHHFHLACLYLPPSFRDPSRRYVCPHCL
ncbi:hypothetical protein ACHHYP_02927 [Achlya hypogyna]|uniref:RING-type domain-containing protein n=1 Tax=Achlya hypogyna TaxID=1202772 RepID=A0A1V9Z545_ACHHY|nr:hypothetical protein ACHHYP_02927 [Achlya hypogyna]